MARREKKPKGSPKKGEWFVLANSPHPKAVAEKIQRAAELVEREFGSFTPEHLVEFSKRKGTPTHGLFEWDVRKAAHARWIYQARSFCACVYKRATVEGMPDIVHALYSIQPLAGGPRRYVEREVFMGDVALRAKKSEELMTALRAISDNANMALLHELEPAWKKVYSAVDSFPPQGDAKAAV